MSQMTMFAEPKTETRPAPQPPRQLPGCSLIYEPKGRAREYAALACNVYSGCDHGCVYCYAPSATRKTRQEFDASTTRPGHFLARLEKEAAKYEAANIQARVLLSFTCDPYQHLDVEEEVTRSAIQILHRHGLNVEVLTKGGYRALRDLDLFTDRDAFATTMTLLYLHQSEEWEPDAASPQSRMDAIRTFHGAGIPTWVSLEPVLFPAQSLEIISRIHDAVDVFKVGALNYHEHAQTIDWPAFAHDAVELLTSLGYNRNLEPDTLQSGDFYVKRDLARYL
jgi:DNA repair photolyase